MATAPLGTTYYPSCVVNLKIRFDDAYTGNSSQAPQVSSAEIAANPPTQPATSTGGLLAFTGNKGDGNSYIVGRIPKTCSVELPAYRQAGKFRMTFDFKDLPIDPRMIRSMGVEIFMDSVPANDFALSVPQVKPVGGQRDSVMTRQGRLSMLKGTPDNLVLMGLVDSWHVSHSSKGSEATIEGRDLVGMFLNTPITADTIANLVLDQPIDFVVRNLVTRMQGWATGMQVIAAAPEEWEGGKVPLVGKSITEQVATPRVRNAAITRGVRLSAGANPDKLNFWDVITRWCYYVGAVPVIRLMPDVTNVSLAAQQQAGFVNNLKVTLLIKPANTIYDQLRATDAYTRNTPFKGGGSRTVDGNDFRVRRMMFGRNIESLEFERKYAGLNLPKLVRVVSYNTSSPTRGEERLLSADYPPEVAAAALADNAALVAKKRAAAIAKNPKAAKRSTEAPSGEIAMQDILRISIPGISDQATLNTLAKMVYEEINRGEMGGSVQTKSMASFGAGNEDPDLVRLRPGDGIQIQVDARELQARAPSVSPPNAMAQKPDSQLIQELTDRLGDRTLAVAIVQTLRDSSPLLANIYRVSNVKYDWNITSGISIAFDFQNYVEVRNNVSPTPVPGSAGAGDLPGSAVPEPVV